MSSSYGHVLCFLVELLIQWPLLPKRFNNFYGSKKLDWNNDVNYPAGKYRSQTCTNSTRPNMIFYPRDEWQSVCKFKLNKKTKKPPKPGAVQCFVMVIPIGLNLIPVSEFRVWHLSM